MDITYIDPEKDLRVSPVSNGSSYSSFSLAPVPKVEARIAERGGAGRDADQEMPDVAAGALTVDQFGSNLCSVSTVDVQKVKD